MSAATVTSPPRIEARPGPAEPPTGGAKKRMLVIVNPYATTVSDRLKNLVVYALQGRYDVEAVSTQAQNHATQICREAREEGYDIVVAFGGDGTLNEVANGLAGTDVPVSVLPGGSTNVVARTLGIPNDVVDATEHLLGLADDFSLAGSTSASPTAATSSSRAGPASTPPPPPASTRSPAQAQGRPLVLHVLGGRGLLRAVPAQPRPDERRGRGPGPAEGVTALAQNSDPFTYFGRQPMRVCEGAALDNGTLSLGVLRRAAQRDVPVDRDAGPRERLSVPKHRQIDHFEGCTERASSRSRATPRTGSGPSPCRSTATRSATTASSTSGSIQAP